MVQVTPGSGAVAEVASWGPSLLVYTTQRGGLAAWDLRMNADAWAMPYQPSQVRGAASMSSGTEHGWHALLGRCNAQSQHLLEGVPACSRF